MRDEAFIRGSVPMTKQEVRAVSVSKLELRGHEIVYDIGAGTGSITIETAMQLPDGHVFAIERREEACSLIRQNVEKFSVNNVTIVEGLAPDMLLKLPAPDCAFIGGTGHRMVEILQVLTKQNPDVRIVLNAISLESISEVMKYCKLQEIEPEVVHMQVAKAKLTGVYHLMQGMNPVYIISWGGKFD